MNAAHNSDVAIIGMSGLFAGAADVDAFWRNILAKVNAITDGPDSWAMPYYDPPAAETVVERIYTRRAGFLGALAEFDPVDFGVVPNAIPATEPDHFLALREASGALRDAGYASKPFDRTRTGIILGRGATPNPSTANGFQSGLAIDQTVGILRKFLPGLAEADYERIRTELKKHVRPLIVESAPGLVSNVAVGRIANRLDLMGPSYMVDAACASSLIALDAAMKELRAGHSDMMLVGGVQASMPPQVYMLFCQLDALTPTNPRPFDEAADGTLLGEGCGFLVLKRLADAERDGDRIYAVVKGTGVASDGRALGLLAPRLEGESLAMSRAYASTGIVPASVGHVEAHGTGIPLGDQTEIAAMKRVFGARQSALPRSALGSVKSMIGHCIPAAGIASLIKSSLALYHRVLPPTLCERPDSARLGLNELPFYVNNQTRPWVHGSLGMHPRRAAVNAFGFGGINAHVLLEEYRGGTEERVHGFPWTSELVVISGADRAAVQQGAQALVDALHARPDLPFGAIAGAAARRDTQGPCRLAIVASGAADFEEKLAAALAKVADPACERLQTRGGTFFSANADPAGMGKTVFLFPGQGSQYPYMFADLCMYFPRVRLSFDLSDAAFADVWKYLPSEYVYPPPTGVADADLQALATGFFAIDVATETIFTAGMAMFELLTAFGLRPDVVLGHSTGEYTAMAASGVIHPDHPEDHLDLKRALNKLYRDFNTAATIPRGALLTIGALDTATLETLMAAFPPGSLQIAMDNCPHQKIVFGAKADIQVLMERATGAGGICQLLPFDTAYHTALMEPMMAVLLKYYEALPLRAPQVPLYSCASVAPFPDTPEAIRALAARQWASPVQFSRTIDRLYAEGVRTFVEMGPSSTLTAFVGDILRGRPHLAISANERTRTGLEQLLRLLATLYVRGAHLEFAPLFASRVLPPLDLAKPEEGRPRKRPTNRLLDLQMPRLDVGDAFAQECFRKAAGLAGAAGAPAAVAGAPSAAPVVPANGDAGAATEDDSLLGGHFRLMHEFMASQRRTAEAFFGRGGSPAANPSPNPNPPTP